MFLVLFWSLHFVNRDNLPDAAVVRASVSNATAVNDRNCEHKAHFVMSNHPQVLNYVAALVLAIAFSVLLTVISNRAVCEPSCCESELTCVAAPCVCDVIGFVFGSQHFRLDDLRQRCVCMAADRKPHNVCGMGCFLLGGVRCDVCRPRSGCYSLASMQFFCQYSSKCAYPPLSLIFIRFAHCRFRLLRIFDNNLVSSFDILLSDRLFL